MSHLSVGRAPGLRVLAAASVAASLLVLAACSRQEAVPEPVRSVRTQVVGTADAAGTLEFAGEVRSRVESRLGFQVGGKIVKRLVALGQPVRQGQALAQIDPRDLQLGQEVARASVSAAQVQYDQAARDLKRLKELRDQGFISAAQLERQEASWSAAQASLRQAKAQAGVQGNQAAYATLTADASGVITSVDAEPGQVVGAGTPVVSLAHDGPRDVVFSVPEDRAAWVKSLLRKPGAVKVRRWGTQATLPATVREIAAAADPVTRTFLVKADVGQADLALGQTATVLVDASGGGARTLRLPISALLGSGASSFVWVLDPSAMTVSKQPVSVAGVSGDGVLIGSGLQRGQEIVTAGVHVLQPG
ncbi:MAG: efflux RND transporter periplasmic adaptor subunit, partial [Aquabacterium sp.]